MTDAILVENAHIFTMDRENTEIENGTIVIQENKIADVGKDVSLSNYKIDKKIDAKHHVVLPGLVNAHMHSTIFPARGTIEEVMSRIGMERALEELYYPFMQTVTPDEVYDEAALAYLESVKSGTTCVNDMYRHIASCAQAAEDVGIRALISGESADLIPGQESLEDTESAFRKKNNAANGRIKIWFGAEWVPVCSPEFFMKEKELAEKYKTGIHAHLNESIAEVEGCKQKFGKRPIEHVYDLGFLGKNVIAVHCVWLTDREIRILKETGSSVATCPVSNMKLGNGVARVPDLLQAGVIVGVGTDACNNNLDMFEATKYLSVVQKGARLDASSMPYGEVLRMATIEGAQALGLQGEIGSIERGKKADLIIVSLEHLRFQPILRGDFSNILPNLVYAARGDDVDTTIVDGKIVMENRVIKTVDESRIIEKAQKSAEKALDRIKQSKK